jgi:hypothetical protein
MRTVHVVHSIRKRHSYVSLAMGRLSIQFSYLVRPQAPKKTKRANLSWDRRGGYLGPRSTTQDSPPRRYG